MCITKHPWLYPLFWIRFYKGLRLETSAFGSLLRWPIHIINPVDKTNELVILPTDAAPQFLKKKSTCLWTIYQPRSDIELQLIISVPTAVVLLCNGNRTEWSLNRTVIIRVITLSRVWLQAELDNTKSYHQLIIKITLSEKRKVLRHEKEKFGIKVFILFLCWLKPRIVIGWFKLQLWKWLAYWTVR